MAAPHSRTSSQKTARKEEIRRLLARRFTQAQIAEQLGVKQQAVSYWAQQIEADAQAAATDRVLEIRATLDSLAEVEREAWAAWERSKEAARIEQSERGVGPMGAVDKTRTTDKYQVGDSTYLNVILACTTQRRALLGLDAPTKAQAFVMEELRAGLERLRAKLDPQTFLQVAGLLAGDAGGLISAA
jgi:predicted transcriptional regulator